MLKGSIDQLDQHELQGWAQDDRFPDRAVWLSIFDNGIEIGRVEANRFRDDLFRANIGDGRHSFKFVFPHALDPKHKHVIRVRTDRGDDLPGSPIELKANTGSSMRGHLDHVDRHHVDGWCQDSGSPNASVSLVITDNGELAGRIMANGMRRDLVAAGIGDGRHAFAFYFPHALSLTESHIIRVRREIDGVDLPGSPVTIDAASEFDSDAATNVAALLSYFDRDEDIDRKILFLSDELESLLQRRADVHSHRSERRRDRDLLRRWGNAARLDEKAPNDSRPGLRALIIDDQVPASNRDAGSNAILSHIRSLQRLGYETSFVSAANLAVDPTVRETLLQDNIEICARPFYASVEEVLSRQAREFDLVYLHRLSNATKYGELVRVHFPKARKIYGVADLHHIRLARQAEVEHRSELLKLSERVKFAEFLAASSADIVITHSSYEADVLRQNLPNANVHRVAWAVTPRPTQAAFSERSGLAFIGGYGHAPNVDAAKWLIDSILPHIRRQLPDIKCYLVGSNLPQELSNMNTDGVELVGHVDNLAEIFDRVRLTIAPLSYGAGIKGKILDSLAAGIPCIHTTLAAEGMNLPAELDCCRADDARTIAAAVCELHANAELHEICRQAGLRFVADELSDETIDNAMRHAIGRA